MDLTPLAVRVDADIGHVRRHVEQVATTIGFDAQEIAALAIVAVELASNLVKHRTVNGSIWVSPVTARGRTGIQLVSRDHGPGIDNISLALSDHYSTAGTGGTGLGAIRRQMDEFEIHSSAPGCVDDGGCGVVITARKWPARSRPPRFEYSACSRPLGGESVNGDAWLVHEDHLGLFVAVVDGLGHGSAAASAAARAIGFLRGNSSRGLDQIMDELHTAMRGCRGAAISIIRIRLPERRLLHIGVGNVEARLYPHNGAAFVSRPGIVGVGATPRRRVRQQEWPADALLVVASDGLSTRWDLRDQPELVAGDVKVIANHLMRNFGKPTDDATVVVAREATR